MKASRGRREAGGGRGGKNRSFFPIITRQNKFDELLGYGNTSGFTGYRYKRQLLFTILNIEVNHRKCQREIQIITPGSSIFWAVILRKGIN
ncbi:hypothetical protein AA650_04700 [Anabaena sp. WA102]|nr:hypothetical protein AA650_04700 [Anabaena sp. WA102]OBQ15684.1 MAG: hypothetical protein AN486_22245 [Anabaena sp. AL93]